jgi:ketosteroid isomerase-like protein
VPRSRWPLTACCALTAGLVGGCGKAPPAADTKKIAQVVKSTVAASLTAINAHDAEKAVAALDAPDFVGINPGREDLNGPADDLEFSKQMAADPARRVVVADEKVDVAASGDLAVYTATYDSAYTDAKSKAPTTQHGNFVGVFRKQADGSMKLTLSISSPLAEPKAT